MFLLRGTCWTVNLMETSAGIVIKDENQNPARYLCVRAYSNWDFPKGHLEEGETILDAAVRETQEEVSLGKTDYRLLGLIAPPVIYKGGKKTAHYFLANRTSNAVPFLPINKELGKPENDEYSWLTLKEMNNIFPSRLNEVLNWLLEQE